MDKFREGFDAGYRAGYAQAAEQTADRVLNEAGHIRNRAYATLPLDASFGAYVAELERRANAAYIDQNTSNWTAQSADPQHGTGLYADRKAGRADA